MHDAMINAAFASPQNKREFVQWYNENKRGDRLQYITETDEFKLHDGEEWNYVSEASLRSDFKKFINQKQKLIKSKGLSEKKMSGFLSFPIKIIPPILVLSLVVMCVYEVRDFNERNFNDNRPGQREKRIIAEAEQRRIEQCIKETTRKFQSGELSSQDGEDAMPISIEIIGSCAAKMSIEEYRKYRTAERRSRAKEIAEWIGKVPCAKSVLQAQVVYGRCQKKYRAEIRECTWTGLSAGQCALRLKSGMDFCVATGCDPGEF